MPWATTNVASVILKFLSFTANRIIWNFHVVIFVFHAKNSSMDSSYLSGKRLLLLPEASCTNTLYKYTRYLRC